MSGAVANTVWARAIIDELARCGLRDVVVAPGSRSTPLVMAADANPRIEVRVHLDERSVGFFALGMGQAGRPTAVVTTSGTAVANLLPAVVEASQASVPLIVLSADRPPRLRGADANQAIDQYAIFGRYPRLFTELSLPTEDPRSLRHLRVLACRAWGSAVGRDPGPVHLNVPFDKPLEPASISMEGEAIEGGGGFEGRTDGAPWTAIQTSRAPAPPEERQKLVALLQSPRPILIAGPNPRPVDLGAAAQRAAERFGCPLLADPLSGGRFGEVAEGVAVAGYDLFLGGEGVRKALEPTAIVRVGRSPISARLQRWLFEHPAVPHVVIDDGDRYKDHGTTATAVIVCDPVATLDSLTPEGSAGADAGWLDRWRRADEVSREMTAYLPPESEAAVAAAALQGTPEGGVLFVSNSMPIRDIDAFAHPMNRTVHVRANRGASGIDGIVSTAFGIAVGSGAPTVCLIGDIAFFHDTNGLLWAREEGGDVVFVLVDNDGGGIFGMLPISGHEPAFKKYFTTPHGLDFEHAAALHGLPYQEVGVADVEGALHQALSAGGSRILRIATDSPTNLAWRAEIARDVAAAVREAVS